MNNTTILWEENNLTEQWKKFESRPMFVPNDGINETSDVSVRSECDDTGSKRWIRKCPECYGDIIGMDKWYCFDANRKRRLCKFCRIKGKRNPNFGKPVSSERKEKTRKTFKLKTPCDYFWYGRRLSDSHKENISIARNGQKLSSTQKEKIRKFMLGNSYRKGIPNVVSNETKRKLRIAKAKYIMRIFGARICPSFNETSCKYFDNLNKERGWSGQYATNGGEYFLKEMGYWVDYYEPTKNIVIEWDERNHYYNGKLKEQDMRRMNEIHQHLKCDFYRIDERTLEMKKYL